MAGIFGELVSKHFEDSRIDLNSAYMFGAEQEP